MEFSTHNDGLDETQVGIAVHLGSLEATYASIVSIFGEPIVDSQEIGFPLVWIIEFPDEKLGNVRCFIVHDNKDVLISHNLEIWKVYASEGTSTFHKVVDTYRQEKYRMEREKTEQAKLEEESEQNSAENN